MINAEVVKEKIISILERRGPCLPIQLAKELNMNSIFTSAFLSELLDDKKIKTSTLRVGGTSLYLLEGQEQQLEKFYNFLHPKEAEAYELLKKKKVLKDSEQEPAIRVALRAIRDFAFSFKNDGQIYWRYLGTTEEEIRSIFSGISPATTPEPEVKAEEVIIEKEIIITEARNKTEINSEIVPEPVILEETTPIIAASTLLPTPEVFEPVPAALKPINYPITPLEETIQLSPGLSEITPEKKELKSKRKPSISQRPLKKSSEESDDFSFDNPLAVKPVEKPKKEKPKSQFVLEVIEFIGKNKWKIIEEKEHKAKECAFIVQINTELGPIDFLTFARDKKSILDKDLDSILRQAQTIPLPALLLYTGFLSKSALLYNEKYYSILKTKKIE
jgi:hypothetical protein